LNNNLEVQSDAKRRSDYHILTENGVRKLTNSGKKHTFSGVLGLEWGGKKNMFCKIKRVRLTF